MATLFTAPSPKPVPAGAQAFHRQCGLDDDAMLDRQIEDVAACTAIGAQHRHLGLLEALYRVDGDGAPRHLDGRAIFQADPAEDPDVVDQVQIRISALLDELSPDLVVGPLGIGNHLDHLVARRALERCGIEPGHVCWFEDVPYAMYEEKRGRDIRDEWRLRPEVRHIGDESWEAKIAGIACYTSQHPVLWRATSTWQTQLRDYALAVGGGEPAERLWHAGGQRN